MMRRRWADIHTVEAHWRISNKSTWISVPETQQVIPEIETVPATETAGAEYEREGPEAAAEMAAELFTVCWEFLSDHEHQRLWFSIVAYGLGDDGSSLVELERMTIGGALDKSGAIEDPKWEEETDKHRARTREDFLFSQNKELVRMNLRTLSGAASFMESLSTLSEAVLGRAAEVAAKDVDLKEAELEAESTDKRTEEAGKAVQAMVQHMAPGFNMWAAAKHAEATKPQSATDLPPHADPVIQAARVLLAQLDGVMVAHVLPVIGADTLEDMLTVLRPALEDDADPQSIAAGWHAQVPTLMKYQGPIAERLPPALSQRLATALQALMLAVGTMAPE